MKPKLLFISTIFDPEPTFKGIEFAEGLSKNGFDVHVVTAFPSYPIGKVYNGYKRRLIKKEIVNGVTVVRLPTIVSRRNFFLRSLNYFSFLISSLIYCTFISRSFSMAYVYHPPISTGILAIYLKIFKKIPYVYDVQDMWPETISSLKFNNNKILLNLIKFICNKIYKYADLIVVLSPGFKRNLISKGVSKNKIEVIKNWASDDFSPKVNTKNSKYVFDDEYFNFIYAGNMGKAQNLSTLVSAAEILQERKKNIKIYLFGSGTEKDSLKEVIKAKKLSNISVEDQIPQAYIASILQDADALIISLIKNDLFSITIPGKTQAYMRVGKPILMSVQGDASQIIKEANCGIVTEPENSDEMAAKMIEMSNMSKDKLKVFENNARNYYKKELSKEKGINLFTKHFFKVINDNQ